MENKAFDLTGRELAVGDFIACATSCTSTGYLRRAIIVGIQTSKRWNGDSEKTLTLICKTVNIGKHYRRIKGENNEFKYGYVIKDLTTGTHIKYSASSSNIFECIKLGTDLTRVFSEAEIEYLKSSTRNVRNSETNEKVNYIDILTNTELRNKQWKIVC